MKAVWKTPEFWATIIGNVLGIVVLAGGLTQEQAGELGPALEAIVGGLLSIATLFGFIKAQATRKAAATALMLARIKNAPSDEVIHAEGLANLDRDVKALLSQL